MSENHTERLDKVLVEKGLVSTRSRARDLIKRGAVFLEGTMLSKPSLNVAVDAAIEVVGDDNHYVSRGSLKLIRALDYFSIDVSNHIALDLGASTGGFSQVLFERGVDKVYAIDVGHGQLHSSLIDNSKIISIENQDVRKLTREIIPDDINIITCDLSFISLTKALYPSLKFVKENAFLVALVKPQFEVGKKALGKGGIVRDEEIRLSAVKNIEAWVNKQRGWQVADVISSPITGQSGNQEYLLGAQYRG